MPATTEKRKYHTNGKTCSCCQVAMVRDPDGHEVAVGWKMLRLERHGQKEIEIKHYLLCPGCTLTFLPRQTTLGSTTLNVPNSQNPAPIAPDDPEIKR